MSSSRRSRMSALAVACVLGLGLAATSSARDADGEGCHGKASRGQRLARALERLELDAETRSAVDEILDGNRDSQRARRREMHQAHRELRALLDAETPDEAAVLAQAELLGGLETEARKERLAARLQVQALLTPEQRAELRDVLDEHPGHGPGRRGR